MSTFVVVAFSDETGLRQGIQALKDLSSDGSLVLYAAATVTKDADGKLSMQVVSDDGLAVVAASALIGGLAGLGVGLLAAAIMAAGGAVAGASAAATNRGADKKIMDDVSRNLRTGSAALVIDVDVADMAAFDSRMKAVGGAICHQE